MVILIGDWDVIPIENPGLCVLEEFHVHHWASDGDVHLAGAKYHAISSTPVTDNVDEALEALKRVGGDIGVVSHAAPSHADVAPEGEAQLGLVHGGETGVDIGLEMSGRLDMTLAVASFFSEGSSYFSIKFELALSVCVGVLGILQNVTAFTHLVKLPDLDLAVDGGKGSLAVKILQVNIFFS